LVGTDVRDKDAVIASLLIMEMILHYQSKGESLLERLEELYQIHGYYLEDLVSIGKKGKAGMEEIAAMMTFARTAGVQSVAGIGVDRMIDYANDETGLPKSDVLKFMMVDGSWFAIRPSGTEPKIKLYIGVKSESMAASVSKLEALKKEILEKILV
jgi:phosphomannomutase